jgi:hypothetical protein
VKRRTIRKLVRQTRAGEKLRETAKPFVFFKGNEKTFKTITEDDVRQAFRLSELDWKAEFLLIL